MDKCVRCEKAKKNNNKKTFNGDYCYPCYHILLRQFVTHEPIEDKGSKDE